MSAAGYARVLSESVRVEDGDPDLLFVDVDHGGEVALIRAIRRHALDEAQTIVVRMIEPLVEPAADLREKLEEVVARLMLDANVAVLVQPLGEPASLQWLHEGSEQVDGLEQEIIERCRAAEVAALCSWGQAIWRAEGFHYQLPSGEHAHSFVRVGDAIRDYRDAQVLASWIHPNLVEGTGIVHDTGTITAVVAAATAAMRAEGLTPVSVTSLDGYPRTHLAVSAALQRTKTRNVVVLLSVNSSGRVLDRISQAARALGSGARVWAHVMVDKHANQQFPHNDGATTFIRWHPSRHGSPIVDAGVQEGGRCVLCEQPSTARLVPIDPNTFDGRLSTQVRQVVPIWSDGPASHEFWEHASRLGAVRLEARPDSAVEALRPVGLMLPVAIDNEKLVADPTWRRSVAEQLIDKVRAAGEPLYAAPQDGVGVLIVPSHEIDLPGMTKLIKRLKPVLGIPEATHGYDSRIGLSDTASAAVRSASSVAVLSLGSVTGVTLHRILVAVQGLRARGTYPLAAMVCHARPPEQRDWETLRNAWGHRLFVGWHTYLAVRDSPLVAERSVLEQFGRSEGSTSDYEAFLDERLDVCAGVADGSPLFWGATAGQVVSPNSIFGASIGQRAVYAAVGSAMEHARKRAPRSGSPERRVFELSAMTRSYYDPLILASMLRWVRPYEVWWGWDEGDTGPLISALIERGPRTGPEGQQYRVVVVSELLLAAAQGKIPSDGVEALKAHATTLQSGATDRARAVLSLGLDLVRN